MSRKIAFDLPRYHRVDSVPFIPQNQELEDVMNASRSLRHAAVLRLLYETGARVGEVGSFQPKDFDFIRRIVRIAAEKGSHAREARLSQQLVDMLQKVLKKYPGNRFPP